MCDHNYSGETLFSLYSAAEFVARMAEDAQLALRAGNPSDALAKLRQAEREAGYVEMHFADAIRKLGVLSISKSLKDSEPIRADDEARG